MNRHEWIKIGYDNGWCGPEVCYTHDDIPLSPIEEEMLNEGDDVCLYILRLYPDQITKINIEENHAPSMWRASNEGLR